MKKVVAIFLAIFIALSGQPSVTAVADSSICHFESLSYYQWPGGGNIDSGVSVGLTRDMATFEPNVAAPACENYTQTNLGTVRESVAHLGVVGWAMYGNEIPTETVCEVEFQVNEQPWFSETVSNANGSWYTTGPNNGASQEALKALLKLGRNILTSVSDCGEFTRGSMKLSGPLDVLQDSFGEFSGVSINEGEDFTNTTDVKLNLSFDGIISQVAVSNDGGFAKAHTQVFDYKENVITWRLRSSTSKLPRKVYVKYRLFDAANDGTRGAWEKTVYTDDIILDETPPVISFIRTTVTTARSTITLDRVSLSQLKVRVINLTADDDKSGVSHYQVSTALRNAPVLDVPTGKPFRVGVKKSRTQIFVRAVDSAGNKGVWKSISTR